MYVCAHALWDSKITRRHEWRTKPGPIQLHINLQIISFATILNYQLFPKLTVFGRSMIVTSIIE